MKTTISCLCILFCSPQAGWSATCREPSAPQDILNCVRENHPDILRANAQARSLGLFEKAAGQRINPELNSEATSQPDDDQPALKVEAAYLHTFELGGKRSRRLDQARAQQMLLQTQIRRIREEVSFKAITSLYRLRQSEAELASINEAIETFGTILGFYKRRRSLSPEQQVSYNVFVLAEADYMLRRSTLLQENESLIKELELTAGINRNSLLKVLPPSKKEWPVLETAPTTLRSARRQEAAARLAFSRSQLGLANSDASPDVRLGPKIAIDSGRGQDSQGFGGALSMSLPLYQRNQGVRALAEVGAQSAQLDLDQTDRELSVEAARRRVEYEKSIQALQKTPSAIQMAETHGKMEDLFQRGIVSAPLVIEAHRQMVDFIKDQNELELRAVESLWAIYALEGRILEEKL